MNPDRHIYLTTVVLAAIFATAINVLMPRDPFAGTTMHREPDAVARSAQAAPAQTVEVATRRALSRRVGTSL
jgi:hypothetical protein